MRKNKLFMLGLSFLLMHSLSAQEYNRGWELSAAGGVQMLFSSDAENLSFKQRLTPSISLSGSKWITPVWGVRLQVGAYSLNGYSTAEGIYLADPLSNGSVYGINDPVRDYALIRPDGSYRHSLRYINAHADLRLSMFNLFCCKEFHKWDIIPAVGVGYFQTFEHKGMPAVSSISANFSLMGKYSVTKALDINLEVAMVVLPDVFDGRIAGKTCENTLGLTVGITYRFKACKNRRCSNQAQSAAVAQIKQDTVVKYVRDTVRVNVEKVVEVEKIVKKETEFQLASIRFSLGSSTPLSGQDIQFVNIANHLKTNPDAKIILEGYGDRESGSAEKNLQISTDRIKNVRDILIKEYNIDAGKFQLNAIGAQEQPYEKQAWNRVVIVKVAE